MKSSDKIRLLNATLAGILVALAVLILRQRDEPVTPIAATADAAPPPLAPPPCIREHCFERPRYLRCTDSTAHRCDKFEIDYEAHCDCVEWGVRLADGGL